MQSMSENDFECFASTGVNTLGQCLRIEGAVRFNFLQADFPVPMGTTCDSGSLPDCPTTRSEIFLNLKFVWVRQENVG